MKTIKEAAQANETIEFKVLFFKELVLGKKATPAFKIGMKCTDSKGEELDGWLTTTIWGSTKSEYFSQKFLESLDIKTSILFDGDVWSYNENDLKYSKGKCKIKLNAAGYPEPLEWIKASRTQVLESPPPVTNSFNEEDIPF